MHDRAQGRGDLQRIGLRDRMGQGDQLDLEGAEIDRTAERHLGDHHVLDAVGTLVDLAPQQGGSEGRGIDRAAQQRPKSAR